MRSEFLCHVLTQGMVAVRVLGESKTLKLPTTATIFATGNSLRVVGDLTHRTVLINLDARMERPEERVFDTDPILVAKENRRELVGAALTLVRAFIVERGPRVSPAMGSFETWSNLIRSTLIWLGEADHLISAEKSRSNNPDRERTAMLIDALPFDRDWTVSQIAKAVEADRARFKSHHQHEVLTEALAEFIEHGVLNRVRFRLFLRKQEGGTINGKRIVNRGPSRNKVAFWRIESWRTRGVQGFAGGMF